MLCFKMFCSISICRFIQLSFSLIGALVNELLIDARLSRVALEERQTDLEEGRTGSQLPQVNSDDDFMVARKNAALLDRLSHRKYWLCTSREAACGSADLGVCCQFGCLVYSFCLD